MLALDLGVVVAVVIAIVTQHSALHLSFDPTKGPLNRATESPRTSGQTTPAAGGQSMSSLAVHVDGLCPFNVICRQGKPRLNVPASDRAGCCTDCSCEEGCGLTERCCDPKMDHHNHSYVDRSHQKCLYPSTVKPFEEMIAYNMIVDGYPNGTGEECGDTLLVKCGDDVTASALGAMYPVYSPKTGRIYVNMKCARCHGLGDQDVVVWNAYLVCDDLKYIDASTYFQYFEDGTMTPSCSIKFSYPGPSSDLQSEQCYSNTLIDTCLGDEEDFLLPDELNMTHSDVAEACKSDLVSPVFDPRWYKNVFCRICDGTNLRFESIFMCNRLAAFDEEKVVVSSFVALLEMSSGAGAALSRPNPTFARRACNLHDGTDCRLAYCPSGKMPDDEGRCQYLFGSWRTDSVGINLKLIPKCPLTVAAIRNIDFKTLLFDSALSVSPWSKKWRIERIMSTYNTDANNVSMVEYFLVRLINDQSRFNIKRVSSDIEVAIKQDWFLSLNGTLVPHRQEFSEITNFVAISERNRSYCFPDFIYVVRYAESPKFIKDMPVPEFEILFEVSYGKFLPMSITVTKMFFCDQVSLVPGEYEIDTMFMVLRHNVTGRIFYPGEIAIVYDEDVTHVPKLCVQDVGYHVVSARGGAGRFLTTRVTLGWMVLIEALLQY